MSFPIDYNEFLDSESEYSQCECHRKFVCECKVEGEEIIVTNTTKIMLGEVIGCGNFSTIRMGVDINTGEYLAVKLATKVDSKGITWSRLSNQQKELFWLRKEDDDRTIGEYKSYIMLNAVKKKGQKRYYVGLPIVYECGIYNDLLFLTMELLGPDLMDLFILCDYSFTLKTVIQITVQLLRNLKYIHSHGIIHRDLKPDNCMIGRKYNQRENVIYLVDFGNSRELIDRRRNAHIRPKIGQSLHGNARFASLNVHLGKELSRRDDLESLCYMIVYFMKGSLPWQGLDASDLSEVWWKVGNTKRVTPISILCEGLPVQFLKFFRNVRKLLFFDTLDYDYWITQFMDLYKENKFVNINEFDWNYKMDESFD